MTLKNARNICAHHSRFWNKRTKARITKRIGRDPHLAPFVECLERQPSFNYTTTFTVLSLCAYCMGIIRPESKWKERCRTLLKTATPFILRGMGAPADWETLALLHKSAVLISGRRRDRRYCGRPVAISRLRNARSEATRREPPREGRLSRRQPIAICGETRGGWAA